MKFSAAALLTLLVAVQAGPTRTPMRRLDDASLAVSQLARGVESDEHRLVRRQANDILSSVGGFANNALKSSATSLVPRGVLNTRRLDDALSAYNVARQAATDPLVALESASTALKEAQTVIDTAITELGGKSTGTGDAKDAKDADPATGGTGGAVVAKTADGQLLPDGRIAADAVVEDFDKETSLFNPDNVKGDGLLFSELILFPDVEASIFDAAAGTKALEVTINDKSIFVPGGAGGEPQTQFRRADLIPAAISVANDSAVTGVRTMHFSLQQDPAKPLALATNEYQLSFLETADFASRTYDVRVGLGPTSPSLTGENIVFLGRSGDNIEELFVGPFNEELQNFAVTLDFDANTIQVFHSTGANPLEAVTEVVPNDNSGLGEYHFALLKAADANGEHATGIDEGIIYAGIFMEDSTDGTVSLK